MKKLNLKWVSDAIGDNYRKWHKGDIVKINAQTGTGKTYFIKTKIIDNMECYEKMLLVANRINLKRQLKQDLCKKFNKPLPTDIKDLDNLTTIGNVTVLSYQQISELKKAELYKGVEFNLDNYDYIICDECHFFFSDGAFNNKCPLAYDALIKTRHREAVKIFISATMDEIEEAINKSYENINDIGFGVWENSKIHSYNTETDYSYLNTKYFKNIKNIIQLIKNDKDSKEKWLIFITNKDVGKYIKKELEEYCTCDMIIADTDIRENENLKSIIENSKFNSKVLICTKAMENGINIQDDLLKNIVIMAFDKITFIQELGRIRIDIENAPKINLFIPTYSWKKFNNLVEHTYKDKFELIKKYNEDKIQFNCKYDYDYKKLPSDIFIESNQGWTINFIGYARLLKDNAFAENMKEKFNKDREYSYILTQLEWLKLENTFSELNLIEDVVDEMNIDNLNNFLKNAYENDEKFTKDYFIETIDNIINSDENLKILFNKLDSGKGRNKGQSKYNELFHHKNINLPYNVGSKIKKETIDGKRKNITYWTISKIES
ncbi:MAG: DEAD/DEAH box helicase [Clostridium cadaveris]